MEGSMGNFPVVCPQGLELIWLAHHPIDVNVHQHLRELLIVESA